MNIKNILTDSLNEISEKKPIKHDRFFKNKQKQFAEHDLFQAKIGLFINVLNAGVVTSTDINSDINYAITEPDLRLELQERLMSLIRNEYDNKIK